MKQTCIQHPANERFLVIRAWQMEACGGNACAAALLSIFEGFHNHRMISVDKAHHANNVAVMHGVEPTQDETLIQFHTTENLRKYMLGLYSDKAIASGVRFLKDKGFVRIMRNPNPRFQFDQTKHFVFETDAVNEWINDYRKRVCKEDAPDSPKRETPSGKKAECICPKGEMEQAKTPDPTSENAESLLTSHSTINKTIQKTEEGGVAALSSKASKPEPVAIPTELNTPEFCCAWDEYLIYRRQAKLRSLAPMTIRQRFATFSGWGVEKSILAIRTAIESGWQGIFEPQVNGRGHGANNSPGANRKPETGPPQVIPLKFLVAPPRQQKQEVNA